MRIEAIESVDGLTLEQRELLRDILLEHPEVDEAGLVLYRLRESDGRNVVFVAPASSRLQVGAEVVSAGWTAGAQWASSNGDAVELQMSESLVRD